MLLSLLLLPFFAGVAACFATLEQPKRPPSSYMLWLNENRPRLVEELGTKNVADVAKAAGMQWKDLGEKEKSNYAEQAASRKASYAKQVEEFITAGGVLQKGKPGKESKKTKGVRKAQRDPNQPKKPASPYMVWLSESRLKLYEELGTKSVPQVAKAAGKKWGALGAKQKAKYEQKAKQLRADYRLELQKFESDGVPQKRPSPESIKAKPSTKAQKLVSRKSISKAKKDLNTPKKLDKAKKDPNAPKKPATAYFLWLNDNRAEIAASLPAGSKVTDVAKAAGVRWKEVAAAERQSYEEKYAVAKAEYKKILDEQQAMAA